MAESTSEIIKTAFLSSKYLLCGTQCLNGFILVSDRSAGFGVEDLVNGIGH